MTAPRPRLAAQQLLLALLCAALFAAQQLPLARTASSWAGANSYYLHALRAPDQAQVLDAMQAAGFKVVRIFINHVDENAKGSNSNGIPDLEDNAVGAYDDTALLAIDKLMVEVVKRKMKLIIALHDRYSLGCWAADAYVRKYNIPTSSNCQRPEDNNILDFYRNAAAAADMDRRFAHILAHQNPSFGGRPWSAIPEAIFGFDIENESQSHSANGVIANPNWVCDRARQLKPRLTGGILVLTGGGADVWDSVLSQHFACPAIDVVCVHTYRGAGALSGLGQIVQSARASGKRVVVEEFGASGGGKAASLRDQISTVQSFGVPWLVWEVVKPGSSDFETFTDDGASWSTLSSGARAALAGGGAFAWPEVQGSSSTPTPTPRPTPRPTPAPTPSTGGPCDKCNVALCRGGCKCDSQCGCRAGLGGSKCDKCNLAQSQGGCKCDNNCDCIAGSCFA